MAQFDVYKNPGGKGFLLDIQADLLDELDTRVVVPLLPHARLPRPAKRLNPVFAINNGRFVMATQYLAAVPAEELAQRVGSLGHHRTDIIAAVDVLLAGV